MSNEREFYGKWMELIALNFLPLPSYVSIDTNSSFIWATPLRDETTHVITHLLAYFAIMRTPNSIKTDNDPACISKHFKQFLHSFSIKQITDISYNPQI